ncbi:putative acyl carrier protein [Hordeum vulgare]|nr:putative acyl carrier protein [Hordeum vulgare]
MSAPFVAMSVSVVFSAHWVQVSSSSSRRRCAACFSRQSFPSISIRPAPPKRLLNLACSAKQDTIDKVCGIVKKQLAVAQDTLVNGDTKFADLGADSLDTVYPLPLPKLTAHDDSTSISIIRQGKRMDGYIPAHFTAIAYALPPSSMRRRLPALSMA